ncbi:DNA adenine methylase [Candidatus Sumerlaeota bacterium]|nr:DNA adenine methylase [Candidatus Sumerlaeota bacterium]
MEINNILSPKAYTGLASFHKYWGKKPIESLSFIIEQLTKEGDIVADPFIGSGLIAKESLELGRRFIGIDINPFSIELTKLFLQLPSYDSYLHALQNMEKIIKPFIDESYRMYDERIGTHYLWENNKLVSVWTKNVKNSKEILTPNSIDISLAEKYSSYKPQRLRQMRFFTNSRINASPSITLNDIFTGRALRNIELILGYIEEQINPQVKRALFLTLTSASGQMSNMVFAIKNRNKNNGKPSRSSNAIEVGSWVIGYWRPKFHFEINVWNCFENRAGKLLRILKNEGQSRKYFFSENSKDFWNENTPALLINNDSRTVLQRTPPNSISLICTDPPHSDRIPYLELSELWNSILGKETNFENEIVVSNAKEREKSKREYNRDMEEFFRISERCLVPNGYIALFFNARDSESWEYIKVLEKSAKDLRYLGCFPMFYSATSVIQDNRKGGMKSDYILFFIKQGQRSCFSFNLFSKFPNWSYSLPERLE